MGPHPLQGRFNLRLPGLCFGLLQIEESGVGLFKYLGKSDEYVPLFSGYPRRFNDGDHTITKSSITVYPSFGLVLAIGCCRIGLNPMDEFIQASANQILFDERLFP